MRGEHHSHRHDSPKLKIAARVMRSNDANPLKCNSHSLCLACVPQTSQQFRNNVTLQRRPETLTMCGRSTGISRRHARCCAATGCGPRAHAKTKRLEKQAEVGAKEAPVADARLRAGAAVGAKAATPLRAATPHTRTFFHIVTVGASPLTRGGST